MVKKIITKYSFSSNELKHLQMPRRHLWYLWPPWHKGDKIPRASFAADRLRTGLSLFMAEKTGAGLAVPEKLGGTSRNATRSRNRSSKEMWSELGVLHFKSSGKVRKGVLVPNNVTIELHSEDQKNHQKFGEIIKQVKQEIRRKRWPAR